MPCACSHAAGTAREPSVPSRWWCDIAKRGVASVPVIPVPGERSIIGARTADISDHFPIGIATELGPGDLSAMYRIRPIRKPESAEVSPHMG